MLGLNKMVMSWIQSNVVKRVLGRFREETKTTSFEEFMGGIPYEPFTTQDREVNISTVAQFLEAVEDGTYKSWSIYKVCLSELLGEGFHGRAVPLTKRGPTYNESLRLGKKYGVTYVPILPLWKKKTTEGKIKMIVDAKLPAEITADLIIGCYS